MAEEVRRKLVKVVVLGDIGRSPRMQYHALSLASHGLDVNIIAYVDSSPVPDIINNPHITITKLHPLVFEKGPKLIQYALKAFWQAISLFLTLVITGKCDYLLCQNPPAIPTLPVCRFYCLVTRTKFVVDWHNYAYSIMALSLPSDSILLRVATCIERYFGQSSDNNFCVTYAMQEDLLLNWNIKAKVLYDRPPKIFHPIGVKEKHNWFLKISKQYLEFGCSDCIQSQPSGDNVTKTAFTHLVGNEVTLRDDRPGLLFSSTSWTPDEDFGILMEALQGFTSGTPYLDFRNSILQSYTFKKFVTVYETTYNLTKKLPKLICVITGKGPMKQHYIDVIASRKWQHVSVITPWLEPCDYPTMVASADLGVCLHTSSSGLDLPMKVIDMFGAGLPVCAYNYKCLHELVENKVTGYTFQDSDELAKQIVAWFEDFPHNEKQNYIAETMRVELNRFQQTRWEINWTLRAKEFFDF